MKNYCEKCYQETNHIIIHDKEVKCRDDYYCDEHHMIIQCAGCEHISFRYEFHDVEGAYPEDGDNWYTPKQVETYPKVIKEHVPIRELYYVPDIVKKTYEQSISAYKEGAMILAGLGFRSVIEAICNDQGIKGKNLEDRINKMSNQGIISDGNAKLLHAVRFLGNDAAHEIKSPDESALNVTLKIIEHIIRSLYILENEANGKMETILDTFDDLKQSINKEIKNFISGDEIPLAKLLGKNIRRFSQNQVKLEAELVNSIGTGIFNALKVGKFDHFNSSSKKLQHYILP